MDAGHQQVGGHRLVPLPLAPTLGTSFLALGPGEHCLTGPLVRALPLPSHPTLLPCLYSYSQINT